MVSTGATSYTYTPRGTLNTRTTNGVTTQLAFNAYDELTNDGTTTNTYDALNRLITTGTTTLTYAGTSQNINNDGATSYTYTPSGDLLGAKQGAGASLALTDLHTDLTALINPATGAVDGSRSYSPFGENSATGGIQTALGYQHQYTDPTTGNINMGARWYEPATGGFTSRDVIGLDPRDLANANRYAYAAANPLTSVDPTGHWGISDPKDLAKKAAKASQAMKAAGTVGRKLLGWPYFVGGLIGSTAAGGFDGAQLWVSDYLGLSEKVAQKHGTWTGKKKIKVPAGRDRRGSLNRICWTVCGLGGVPELGTPEGPEWNPYDEEAAEGALRQQRIVDDALTPHEQTKPARPSPRASSNCSTTSPIATWASMMPTTSTAEIKVSSQSLIWTSPRRQVNYWTKSTRSIGVALPLEVVLWPRSVMVILTSMAALRVRRAASSGDLIATFMTTRRASTCRIGLIKWIEGT